MQGKKDIYIIGAGISGLIAAYELEQNGLYPTIIEQSASIGGRVKTLYKNGYPLDLGFQVLLSSYPMAKKYLDYDKLDLCYLESGAMVYADHKSYLIGDPLRNWKHFIPTIVADIGSFGDKLRILKLNRLLKNKSLEDIFHTKEQTTQKYLVEFGFTPKIIERFFKPFFAGIFLEPDLKTSSRMFEFIYKMFGEGNATIPKLGIGTISKQLKNKLQKTNFMFNSTVEEITSSEIAINPGERLPHQGVIVTGNASTLLEEKKQSIQWKGCMCFYFEVDQTNIPPKTIALVADSGKFMNNIYAYKDEHSGKTILSVTTLKQSAKSDQEIIELVTEEVIAYTKAKEVKYIQHFRIKQALPSMQNLKMTAPAKETKAMDNVFLAGDYLLNGSLNAAMESGRLAAEALINK